MWLVAREARVAGLIENAIRSFERHLNAIGGIACRRQTVMRRLPVLNVRGSSFPHVAVVFLITAEDRVDDLIRNY
jgi:hypothetical protein